MISRSPPFSRNATNVASEPRDRIVSTPTSDTAMPATCSEASRSRRSAQDNPTIITGMNEFRITPFTAVV